MPMIAMVSTSRPENANLRWRRRCFHRAVIAGACVASATACSSVTTALFGPPRARVRSISIQADNGANLNTACAIDFVFVYDASAQPALPATGPEWFIKRDLLRVALGRQIDVLSVSIAPGMTSGLLDLPSRHSDALRVLGFANYLAASGQEGANLSAYQHLKVRLMSTAITFSDE